MEEIRMRFHFKRHDLRRARKQRKSPAQRWLATGALAFYTVTGGAKSALAQQSVDVTKVSPSEPSNAPVVQFDIPGSSLATAIKIFSNATALHVNIAKD